MTERKAKPKKQNDGIEKLGRGMYRVYLNTHWPDGSRRRMNKTVRGSRADAEKALCAWPKELEAQDERDRKQAEAEAQRVADEEERAALVTVGAYCEKWHTLRVTLETVRKSTLKGEATTIRRITSYLGDVPLCELDAARVRDCYSILAADGLTKDAIYRFHAKLKQILDSAVDDDVIVKNPCRRKSVKVCRPKASNSRKSLTPEEGARLLAVLDDAGDDDGNTVGVRIGLKTGMRIGEVLGLTWEHVDLDNGIIVVCRQYTRDHDLDGPKTESSERKISVGPDTITHLKAWKEAQAKQLRPLMVKQKPSTPVVSDECGGFHDSNNYRRWFCGFCVRNGYGHWTTDDGEEIKAAEYRDDGTRIDGNGRDANGKPYSRVNKKPRKHYSGLKFHELRHTQATLLIANGTDIKTVQHRLGHSKASVTLDMYAHAMPENDRDASELIDSLFSRKPTDSRKVVNL